MSYFISMPSGENLLSAIDRALVLLASKDEASIASAVDILSDAKRAAIEASSKQSELRDFVEVARTQYAEEGAIEIDDNALVSIFEGEQESPAGAYVQAWVFVRTEPE